MTNLDPATLTAFTTDELLDVIRQRIGTTKPNKCRAQLSIFGQRIECDLTEGHLETAPNYYPKHSYTIALPYLGDKSAVIYWR